MVFHVYDAFLIITASYHFINK